MAIVLFRNVRSGKRKAALLDLDNIVRKEIDKVMEKQVKPTLIKSHELIVRDWNTSIGFQARKFITSTKISVSIFPTGPNKRIWFFVDRGTKRHPMPAVSGKFMVFQAGGTYNPKTLPSPARTVSGGGNVTGGTKVITKGRKAFTHPGSKARNFTKTIAEDIKPGFKRVIENAFRRTAKKVEE